MLHPADQNQQNTSTKTIKLTTGLRT